MSVTTDYTVAGMTCAHCASAVTEELTDVTGVDSVDVDVETGRVRVVSAAALDTDTVRAAVDEAGYELVDNQSPQVP